MNNNHPIFAFILAGSFKFDSMSPALAPGIHLTMVCEEHLNTPAQVGSSGVLGTGLPEDLDSHSGLYDISSVNDSSSTSEE